MWENTHVRLLDHSTARNQAAAKHRLSPGTTIVFDVALSAVLIPEEKGSRCDACFRRSQNDLKRCSGCVEYWYCGLDCQNRHWRAVHKYMCKSIAKFRASLEYQAIPSHGQMDANLLSHLIAEHGDRLARTNAPSEDINDPLATFASLIPQHNADHPPVICTVGRTKNVPSDLLRALYNRFSNNNFIVHSHLNPVGHGIFPLASRLLNHSCIPNAVVVYDFGTRGVCLKVKALTEIQPGEEVTIPYFDPALPFHRRQEICRSSYNFECTCANCTYCKTIESIPSTHGFIQRADVGSLLLKFAFPDMHPTLSTRSLSSLPEQLFVVLDESFLPSLSKTFSDAAHDGPYELALRSGMELLALYLILYPCSYPQTGLHCLEMAKTAWNASVQKEETKLLVIATDSLSVLGQEGDAEDGPLLEAATLNELLQSS
ncbi:SET domain-containing protein [Phellopilus nigrolimitatus]|nr:SET domain-containing protein [Phellopilus nigrolimitatus]